MSIGAVYPTSRSTTAHTDTEISSETSWDAPSPTESNQSSEAEPTSPPPATAARPIESVRPAPQVHFKQTSAPSRPALVARTSRPRGLGLTPLSTNTSSLPLGTGALPKSQPLSRALFARMAHDTPHAGMTPGAKKKIGGQKMIVPTKAFKTTFELDLSASELARR